MQLPQIHIPPRKASALFVLVALVILLISIYMKSPQRSPLVITPPVASTLDQPKGIQNISFNAEVNDFPQELTIYASQAIPPNPVDIAQNLSTKLGMTPEGNVENTWINKQNNSSLTIAPRGVIKFQSNVQPSTAKIGSAPDINRFVLQAKTFLSTFAGIKDLDVDINNIAYTSFSGETRTPSAVNQTIAIVPFIQLLDTYPIFYNDSFVPAAQVYLDSNFQVLQIEFTPTPTTLGVYKKVQPYSKEQIAEQIVVGNVQLLSSYLSKEQAQIDEIRDIFVHALTIEYRYSSQSSLVYPYYLLDATGTTADNRTLTLQLLVPAVPLL